MYAELWIADTPAECGGQLIYNWQFKSKTLMAKEQRSGAIIK